MTSYVCYESCLCHTRIVQLKAARIKLVLELNQVL